MFPFSRRFFSGNPATINVRTLQWLAWECLAKPGFCPFLFLGPLGNRPNKHPTKSAWPLQDVDQPDLEEIEDEPEVGDDLSPWNSSHPNRWPKHQKEMNHLPPIFSGYMLVLGSQGSGDLSQKWMATFRKKTVMFGEVRMAPGMMYLNMYPCVFFPYGGSNRKKQRAR